MKGTHHYTATDIERYHQGGLTPAERHALEKAALDDPFLADALEGYAVAQTPAADLAQLQQKLQNRVENESRRRGFFAMPWVRVAALVVVVAGAAWLATTFTMRNNPVQPVATRPAPRQTEERRADSPGVFSDAAAVDQTTVAVPRKSAASEEPPLPGAASPTAGAGAYKIPEAVLAPTVQDSLQDGRLSLRDVAQQRETQGPPPAATEAAVAAPPKPQAMAASSDTIRNLNITLKRNDEALNEVVLGKSAGVDIRRRQPNVMVDSLEPWEGWTRFDDYIANNLREPEEYKKKPLAGEVELSFDVNKKGEPVNIAVTRSLCQSCDAEAIRLLKEGPRWKKGKKGKVKIKFPQAP